MFDCVLDTGSTRIVVPQRYWRDHVPSPDSLTGRRIRGVSEPLDAYEAEYGVVDTTVTRLPPYSLGTCTVCLARDEEAVEAAMDRDSLDRATARSLYTVEARPFRTRRPRFRQGRCLHQLAGEERPLRRGLLTCQRSLRAALL